MINALIIATGGIDEGMQKLMAWTGLAIFVELLILTIRSFTGINETKRTAAAEGANY